jgi:hypothetical protein
MNICLSNFFILQCQISNSNSNLDYNFPLKFIIISYNVRLHAIRILERKSTRGENELTPIGFFFEVIGSN